MNRIVHLILPYINLCGLLQMYGGLSNENQWMVYLMTDKAATVFLLMATCFSKLKEVDRHVLKLCLLIYFFEMVQIFAMSKPYAVQLQEFVFYLGLSSLVYLIYYYIKVTELWKRLG